MKKFFLPVLSLFLFLSARHATLAGEQDFTLINATGHAITAVYVSPSAAHAWQEDILGQDKLGDGQKATIKFSGAAKAAKWEIKVVDEDKKEIEFKGFDLLKINQITLHLKGDEASADYK